jgi:hypothetical protein
MHVRLSLSGGKIEKHSILYTINSLRHIHSRDKASNVSSESGLTAWIVRKNNKHKKIQI